MIYRYIVTTDETSNKQVVQSLTATKTKNVAKNPVGFLRFCAPFPFFLGYPLIALSVYRTTKVFGVLLCLMEKNGIFSRKN